MKLHAIVTLLTFICFISSFTLPTTVATQGQEQTRPSNKEERKLAQVESGKRMSGTVRKARQMLLEARVPFEPSFLFSRNWKKRVAPFLDQMPEMNRSRAT